jgi:hypothetical protein
LLPLDFVPSCLRVANAPKTLLQTHGPRSVSAILETQRTKVAFIVIIETAQGKRWQEIVRRMRSLSLFLQVGESFICEQIKSKEKMLLSFRTNNDVAVACKLLDIAFL